MAIFNLKPARRTPPEEIKIVSDLDRMIAEPVGFRFKGKIHIIKPMEMGTYLKAVSEFWKIRTLILSDEPKNQEVLIQSYAKLFSSVCDTISLSDVYDMTIPQIEALFHQIHECVNGKAHSDSTEKKTLPPSA